MITKPIPLVSVNSVCMFTIYPVKYYVQSTHIPIEYNLQSTPHPVRYNVSSEP